MKRGIIIVGSLIGLCVLAFAAYLIADNLRLKRAYANYPVAYTEIIQQNAEEFDLDPYLVTSIMRCESSNDPAAVSDAGAIGLMQIMPDTGAWIAHKLDMDDSYDESMLYEPAVNIRFGCWYLRFLSGRFDGRIMEIVAAYNAGHGSVEDWLENPNYAENGVLTGIAFPATASYYEKVMQAYDNYVSLYPTLYGE